MNWVDAVAILVYTVGTFTFGTVLVVDLGNSRDRSRHSGCASNGGRHLRTVGTALNAACMLNQSKTVYQAEIDCSARAWSGGLAGTRSCRPSNSARKGSGSRFVSTLAS